MKALCLGSINIDEFYTVKRIVRPGETVMSSSVVVKAGGKGANQAVALARAGAPTCMGGCIGPDGEWILDHMRAGGVDVSLVQTSSTQNTGKAIIQLATDQDHGENSVILFQGANFHVTPDYVASVLTKYDAGDCLVLQNEISSGGQAMRMAKQKDMWVVFSPAPMAANITAQYPFECVDVLCMNHVEAMDLFRELAEGEYIVSKLLHVLNTLYPNIAAIVLTQGKEGVHAYIKGRKYVQPAVHVEHVVDTTGAGDVFLGYFIAQLMAQQWSPTTTTPDEQAQVIGALRVAVHAASLCVQVMESLAKKAS